MNINEYISSGILEQYITGTTTAQETQEVACMSHIYPEIHAELQAIQQALEALAQEQSVAPPTHLRKNIFDAIDALENNAPVQNESTKPGNNVDLHTTPTTIPGLTFNKNNTAYKSAAAILFMVSAGLGYLLYDANKNTTSFANDLAIIKKEIATSKTIVQSKETQITVLQNKEYQAITMAGVPTKDTNYKANIYFNKQSQEVYVALDNLPQPVSGKQYQLWAIADGKPVDLGMVDLNNTNSIMQKMKGIKNPQAFAITLEKEGGVPSPTMAEMVVMGGV
jgi:anti-sigma-K factor RskA